MTDGAPDARSDAPPGCTAEPFPQTLRAELRLAVEASVERAGSTGALIGAEDIDGRSWISDASDPQRRVYSVGKTFTAATVLTLVDDGDLHLDAPIADWFPQVPNAGEIRVRNLLGHTSGLRDYLFFTNGRWPEERSHAELLELVEESEPLFGPGTAYQYSNTNYLILGLLIEAITGRPYHEVVRERIFEPAQMDSTYLEGYENNPRGTNVMVPGHATRPGFESMPEAQAVHPSITWAAGGFVSTACDLTSCFSALFGEQSILNPQTLEAMRTPGELADGSHTGYGLGLTIVSTVRGPLIGHLGGWAGFRGPYVDHIPETHAYIGYLADEGVALSCIGFNRDGSCVDIVTPIWATLIDE